jgi:predicted DNA-binding protein
MLSIPMDAEIEQHLEALGAKTVDSKTEFARRRLLEALREDREDQQWARIAEERLAQPEKTYSLEEVVQDLGLDS